MATPAPFDYPATEGLDHLLGLALGLVKENPSNKAVVVAVVRPDHLPDNAQPSCVLVASISPAERVTYRVHNHNLVGEPVKDRYNPESTSGSTSIARDQVSQLSGSTDAIRFVGTFNLRGAIGLVGLEYVDAWLRRWVATKTPPAEGATLRTKDAAFVPPTPAPRGYRAADFQAGEMEFDKVIRLD